MLRLGRKGWARWLAVATLAAPLGMAVGAVATAATVAPAWAVNKPASHLQFRSSAGGSSFTGSFSRWNADIRFDPKNLPGSSVSVRVDMTSARTGASDKDEALPGADWFATARFAQATFVAKSFKDLGGGRYQAQGTLTIRGVTRPVGVAFTLAINGAQAHMQGQAVVDRHVFGVGQGQFASADTVPFAVQVGIDITAKRG